MQAETQTLNVRLTWSDVVTSEGRELVAPLPITFGRANDNTIALNSNKVSRRHAVLRSQDGQVMLEDLQSTNGTFVNGRRIAEMVLSDDDRVTIGGAELVVRLEG